MRPIWPSPKRLMQRSDDFLVPAPLMSPTELLALFVDGARLPANREKRRDPTAFEVSWYEATHALARR